jgi:uncharacterized coiled-coil protein SlyX
MPEDPDIVQRIGHQVREHDARLELHDERLRGLERLCDADPDGDLRRRVERVESILAEHQALMRESTLMIARLNETLIDFKFDLGKMRESSAKLTESFIEVRTHNHTIRGLTVWLGGIAAAAIASGITLFFSGVAP